VATGVVGGKYKYKSSLSQICVQTSNTQILVSQGIFKENLQLHNSPLPPLPLLAGIRGITPRIFLELEMLVGEF